MKFILIFLSIFSMNTIVQAGGNFMVCGYAGYVSGIMSAAENAENLMNEFGYYVENKYGIKSTLHYQIDCRGFDTMDEANAYVKTSTDTRFKATGWTGGNLAQQSNDSRSTAAPNISAQSIGSSVGSSVGSAVVAGILSKNKGTQQADQNCLIISSSGAKDAATLMDTLVQNRCAYNLNIHFCWQPARNLTTLYECKKNGFGVELIRAQSIIKLPTPDGKATMKWFACSNVKISRVWWNSDVNDIRGKCE